MPAAAPKLDLYALHKDEYAPSKTPVLIEIKPAQYLTISGQGEPGGTEFTDRVGAIFSVAFTLKMGLKSGGNDYKVAPLEALWWDSKGGMEFMSAPRASWRWKLLIRTPDFVKKHDVSVTVRRLEEKGKTVPVWDVALETIGEGLSVQMLHVGPYANEQETIAQMLVFAGSQGKQVCGPHHEIYLSDPRRVMPEKLKTILRLPVS